MFKLDMSTAKLVVLADGIPIDSSTDGSPSEFFDMMRQADNLLVLWRGTLNALGCPNQHQILREDHANQIYQIQITWNVPTESSDNSCIYTVCAIKHIDQFLNPES